MALTSAFLLSGILLGIQKDDSSLAPFCSERGRLVVFSSPSVCLEISLSFSNFLLTPFGLDSTPFGAAAPLLPRMPAWTRSKSSRSLAFFSASSNSLSSLFSNFRLSASFFNRFKSLFCASRLLTAHSLQNKWPWLGHDTGSRAGSKQSWHDPNGKKESRVNLVDREPQMPLSSLRSWLVKKASDVFLLPRMSILSSE